MLRHSLGVGVQAAATSTKCLTRLSYLPRQKSINAFGSRKASISSICDVIQTHVVTSDEEWRLPILLHVPAKISNDLGKEKEVKASQSPLLLISGWTGVAADWGALPKIICSKTNRVVITYDPRRLGYSQQLIKAPCTPTNTSDLLLSPFETMVSDAKQVMLRGLASAHELQQKGRFDKLDLSGSSPFEPSSNFITDDKINKISLAGVSMGGMIAQKLAAHLMLNLSSPGRAEEDGNGNSSTNDDEVIPSVESLILIATTPGGTAVRPSPQQKNFFRAFQNWTDAAANEGDMKSRQRNNTLCAERFFLALGEAYQSCASHRSKQVMRNRLIDKFVASRQDHFLTANNSFKEGVEWQLQAIRTNFDSTSYLPDLGGSLSSVIIHGEDDSVIPAENALRMHQHLSSLSVQPHLIHEYHPIKHCDHMCWLTHPFEMIEPLCNFLNIQR